jgi:hypothetical protein
MPIVSRAPLLLLLLLRPLLLVLVLVLVLRVLLLLLRRWLLLSLREGDVDTRRRESFRQMSNRYEMDKG